MPVEISLLPPGEKVTSEVFNSYILLLIEAFNETQESPQVDTNQRNNDHIALLELDDRVTRMRVRLDNAMRRISELERDSSVSNFDNSSQISLPEWASGNAYRAGDRVQYRGFEFRAGEEVGECISTPEIHRPDGFGSTHWQFTGPVIVFDTSLS